jgi:threonylcarbamoyladenosine tRNA methylthiotransferase MtaB
MRIAIYTHGCKVNQSESAQIEGELKESGHEIVNDLQDKPDACIINTCTVTAKSDYQSRQTIRRAVRSGARVIATGCYAQLRPDDLSKIRGIDLILGNSEKVRLSEHLNRFPGQNNRPSILIKPPQGPVKTGSYHSTRTRAFLKIQDGCNFSCSYCTVPLARGKSRSLDPADVSKAVDKFSRQGYKEIVLTGIHIGSYGLDLKPVISLSELVTTTVSSFPEVRFRLSSIEPQEITEDILKLMKHDNICNHLHIPLQNGSDAVLKRMKRGYSASFFEDLINRIVSIYPDISLGTDIIAGFPGESEKDFSRTIELLRRLPLSYIHVFPYSQRPETPASSMKGQVGSANMKQRVHELLKIAGTKKKDYLKRFIGKQLEVIVEILTTTNGLYRGISDNYIRIFIRSNDHISGKKLRVKPISLTNEDLIGIPSKSP